MRLKIENIDLSSNSGPNSFASKLSLYIEEHGVRLISNQADAYLCFIESERKKYDAPMYQRLDGIYFNTSQNYNKKNSNIRRTYEMADGVIFQSKFNMLLTTKYFGEHKKSIIIHNGADLNAIQKVPEFGLNRYDNLWCCASSWRPHKRLNENIRYFLEHSGPNDGMIIAGSVPQNNRINDAKLHYVGVLSQSQLYSLYKKCKYFVHLAWLDHCPNVVADARACGCIIICSSTGGTKEIAGDNAVVIREERWDFEPVDLYKPPPLDFTKKCSIGLDSILDMSKTSKSYKEYIFGA